ncbi:Bifunctional cis-abienol synthase, chloroplastic [Frankliniella fusca]|uniref:Bifunctional cis-abienol synthase, chloroplastic n=1 Tax=Frankliniella fusca TaxID=407009 RepID=A0AAE1H8P3_9NEOP|nr:Bifunctional cis-abienol synthase, chloroplastic [Frankliniella fusca]
MEKLQNIDSAMPNISVEVFDSVLAEFVFTFADTLVINISRRLRDASTDSALRKVVFDEEERKTIYYIGGHICHAFKEMGYKYPKSKKWKTIVEIVQAKIMETRTIDELTEQEKKDRDRTEKKDRGGLIKVNGKMQKFLLSAAEIIACFEESDGSLPIDQILEKVAEGKPKYEWDSVVGNAMDETLSFSLMVGVVRSLINTYGKGIVYRRMNAMNKNKATASLTLRHKVAPRS